MTYRDNSDGTRDTRPMTLYGYTVNLSSTKTVKSIALPANRNVVVVAMNLSGVSSSTSSNHLTTGQTFDKTQIVLVPTAKRAKR
jgi:hypothetical protein